MKKQGRARDINRRAASWVAPVTGDAAESPSEAKPLPESTAEERHVAAVTLGRKGGQSRAKRLTPERRKEIAVRAALARWVRRD